MRLASRSIMFTVLHRHHLRHRHLRAQTALHYHHLRRRHYLRRRHLRAQTALFRYHMYVGAGRFEPVSPHYHYTNTSRVISSLLQVASLISCFFEGLLLVRSCPLSFEDDFIKLTYGVNEVRLLVHMVILPYHCLNSLFEFISLIHLELPFPNMFYNNKAKFSFLWALVSCIMFNSNSAWCRIIGTM